MSSSPNRRGFLELAAWGGTAVGLGQLGFLRELPRVSAAEAVLDPKLVSVESGIEPLVRLLEETSRDQLLERVAARVRQGVSYREVLAALLLAGVRNVQPRPSVGFKFHAVLVVNSAHLASISGPDSDRWLPIFWALDYFKSKQLEEKRVSGWRMAAVDENKVPAANQAIAQFTEAMDRWDAEAADAAVAALARTAGANTVFETLYRYGCRDYRSIGHKAIYVANSARALQCIGWQYAEPILRSLTFALLNHTGEPNPADSDLDADRPWRKNQEREKGVRADWLNGKGDAKATRDLLAVLRKETPDASAESAVEMLNRGVSPQSVWDAVLVGSGELLMRQPGIIGLHTLTSANAMHHAFQTSSSDSTRRLLLLQACSFLPMFRKSAEGRGKVSDDTIDDLKTHEFDAGAKADDIVAGIFEDVSGNRRCAAEKIRTFLQNGGDLRAVIGAARRLVFLKGRDAHDYKFNSAVLEDCLHVSEGWRPTYLALSAYNFRGSRDGDSQLVPRTREALKG